MKRWWVVAALFLSVGVNVGLLASLAADRWRPDPVRDLPRRFQEAPPGERLEELADRLGVPPDARARFFESHRRFFEETARTRSELERTRMELRVEITADRPREGRIDELVERSARHHRDLEATLVGHVLEAREILDGEAERRYLHFLSRLARGDRGGPGPGRPGLARPGVRVDRPGPP